MGRYEIEMEITGFRLKIRGDREDIPIIKHNLQHQMVGLIDPAANIAQSRLPSNTIDLEPSVGVGNGKARKARRPRRPGVLLLLKLELSAHGVSINPLGGRFHERQENPPLLYA